jgi:hypothetical protein
MFLEIQIDPSILDVIPANWWQYLVAVLTIAKVAEIIVKLTPNKTDDKILGFITPILKFLSLNAPDIDELKKKDK